MKMRSKNLIIVMGRLLILLISLALISGRVTASVDSGNTDPDPSPPIPDDPYLGEGVDFCFEHQTEDIRCFNKKGHRNAFCEELGWGAFPIWGDNFKCWCCGRMKKKGDGGKGGGGGGVVARGRTFQSKNRIKRNIHSKPFR